ncbi:MAG: hypothetical protein K5888_12660 [Lachnospiraceae bacterium]|nr:hypothetical protein [Lachnospiraceae bacterium]
MPGIKTDTAKLNEARDRLTSRCKYIKDLLGEFEGTVRCLDECMYMAAVPVLKKDILERIDLMRGQLDGLGMHIQKLDTLKETYDSAERRNTDESYSIHRS